MTRTRIVASAAVSVLAMVLAGCGGDYSTSLPSQDQPDAGLCFRDVTGAEHRPFACPQRRTVVFLFVLQDCPIANAFAPEIGRILEEYAPRGVAFFLVHADPDLSLAEAHQHAAEHGLRLPVVVDAKHELARRAGATRAPEAAVFTTQGSLAYRGRIDDRFADFGKLRVRATQRDLRGALDAVLADRSVPQPWPEPVGCFIPGLDGPLP